MGSPAFIPQPSLQREKHRGQFTHKIAKFEMSIPPQHSFKIHEVNMERTERQLNKSTHIFGDFNTPLSVINRTGRQKEHQ